MRSRGGSSSIEVVLVLVLLIAVSFLVFATVSAGSQAFFHLSDRRDRDADLRVAMSYIDVKIRKSDAQVAGGDGAALPGVSVTANPFGAGDALRFRSRVDGQLLVTLVFCRDGQLFELFSLTEEPPDVSLAIPVARVEGLKVTPDPASANLLGIELTLEEDTLTGNYLVRSGVVFP